MQRIIFILGLALLALSGCGQKGPLYLPDEEQEMNQLQRENTAP